jgi:hypothetical protein
LPRGPSTRVFGIAKSTRVNANSRKRDGALFFLEFLHSRARGDLIHHQAGGLAPVIEHHYADTYLKDRYLTEIANGAKSACDDESEAP